MPASVWRVKSQPGYETARPGVPPRGGPSLRR